MQKTWPGEPHEAWNAAEPAHRDLWVPRSDDLPAFRTPEDLIDNYSLNSPWWARALLATLLVAILVVAGWAGFVWIDWEAYGWLRRTLFAACGVVIVVGCAWGLYRFITRELRWFRERTEIAQTLATKFAAEPIGIWGLFVGTVRLRDRMSGVNDAPDDIVFLFDMRASEETLQHQRAAATAWIESIAAAAPDTNIPPALSDAFAGRRSVHCAEVFGLAMRGVWMARKGSVLPFETLGLAMIDPQTADEFSTDDVIFLRRTPRDLRHRSRIGKA